MRSKKDTKKNKKLLICTNCSTYKKVVLGEIRDEYLWIMRFHNGFTKVKGKNLSVTCGECGSEGELDKTEVV